MGETKGFQPAISNDGYIYLCVSANSSTELVCACYKLSNYVAGSAQTPVWTRTITAKSAQCGYGAVLDKEGTPYFMGGDKLVRLNKDSCCPLPWMLSLVAIAAAALAMSVIMFLASS